MSDNRPSDLQGVIFALDRLTDAILGRGLPSQSRPEDQEEEKPKRTRTRKTTTTETEKKTRSRKPRATKASPETQMKAKLKEVSEKFDRAKAADILDEYANASKVSEVDPEDYENVILACDEVLAEDENGDDEDF